MAKFLKYKGELYSLVDSAEEVAESAQTEAKVDSEAEVAKDNPADILQKVDNLLAELTAEVEKLKHELQ